MCMVCGSNAAKEHYICPQRNDALVCVYCHNKCEFKPKEGELLICRYRIQNPIRDFESEIYKLDRQIKAKTEKANYYYKRSWPKLADKLLFEVSILKREKKKVVEEKEKWEREQR